MYLPEATFTGKSLYYSYETCGSKDYFTKKYNTEAAASGRLCLLSQEPRHIGSGRGYEFLQGPGSPSPP